MRDPLQWPRGPFDGPFGGSASGASTWFRGVREWITEGRLNFAAPGSEAWAAAADWLVAGVLDFTAPIAPGSWSVPEGTPYTILAFEEPTQ